MIPLGGTAFPTSREQLIAAITQGLGRYLTLPSGDVAKLGGNYPDFSDVMIDLTHAKLEGQTLPPPPRGTGQTQGGVSTQKLTVTGKPLFIRQAPVTLNLSAASAKFDYDRDESGGPLLALADARDGRVTIEIQRADLEKLIMAEAKTSAARQGVQVQDVKLALTQLDPRSIAAEARVKAKKLFVTATVVLRGTLKIDDALNATVSGLTVSGEGMMGEMASGALRPKLAEVDGKSFPLSALSLGQVKLRDIRLEVGETLKVTAAFGGVAVA